MSSARFEPGTLRLLIPLSIYLLARAYGGGGFLKFQETPLTANQILK